MSRIKVSDIEIDVIKKNIKNLHLSVLPPDGRVRISVPLQMKDEMIRLFVISKISWIKKARSKFENQAKQTVREYVSGESVYIWGRRYQLNIEYTKAGYKIDIRDNKLYFYVRERSTAGQRENAFNEWYRKQLKEQIPLLLKKWEPVIGVKSEEFGVKNMRTRWGTCNVKDKRIWLNLQLAKKPPECLEYVVVHELVHLLEKRHNKVFKGYMDKFLPNWRAIKDELNYTLTEPI